MAGRQAITPRQFAGNAYYPEDDRRNAERQRLLENNWMDWYKQNLSPDAIRNLTYNYAKNELGMSEEAAALQADHAANTATRTGYIADATALAPVAGLGSAFGREAIATAKALRAAPAAAAEAPGAVRLLGGPSTRNAQTAEEMLTPNVIYGESAEGAPRLTYAKPETRYRMALDRTAESRPLTNYERPAIDERFVRPEDVRPFNAGNVRGTVDPLDVLAAEGGQSSEAVALAQRLARQKAEGRAATVANEESRFAGGEGPNYAEEILNRRRLAAEEQARIADRETRFQSGQVDAMANEGGGAGRQAMENELNRAARADFEARQLSTLGDEAGAITSGRNPPNRVARALQVAERQTPAAVAPNPGTGFTMIDTPGQGFTMTPPSRAMTMRTVGSEAAGTQAPASTWYGEPPSWQRAGYHNPNVDAAMEDIFNATHGRQGATVSDPLIAATPGANKSIPWGAVLGVPAASMATVYGATKLIDQINGPRQTAGQPQAPMPIDPEIKTRNGWPVYFTGPQYDINDKTPADWKYATPAEVLGSRRATASAIDSAYAPVVSSSAPVTASQQAVQQARTQTAPMPPTRPAELAREQPSILSKIFGQPATTRQLFEQSQADPSDSGAWMRAERQYAKTHKDEPNFDVTKLNEQGMKRGGAAGKPDSVHKALEIIHHLLTRNH